MSRFYTIIEITGQTLPAGYAACMRWPSTILRKTSAAGAGSVCIKPLYYIQSDDAFAFASEPQALLAAGFGSRKLSERAVEELLQLQFTTGAETPYKGICRVLPGETIVMPRGGQSWTVGVRKRLPAGGPVRASERQALERWRKRWSIASMCISGQTSGMRCSYPRDRLIRNSRSDGVSMIGRCMLSTVGFPGTGRCRRVRTCPCGSRVAGCGTRCGSRL